MSEHLHITISLSDDTRQLVKSLADAHQHNLGHILTKIMGTLADIQTQNTALLEAVKEEDTVIDSAIVLLTGLTGQVTDLQKQLADAIASNDPAALQAVADSLGATAKDITDKKQALASALVANTPASNI